MKTNVFVAAALLSVLALGAHAQGPVVNLDAQVAVQLENDEMTVTLSAVEEGTKVQQLSQSVLSTMQRAVARAKRAEAVSAALGSIATYPVWGPKGKTGSWTVRSELVLTSKNFTSLGLLASELTSDLQLTNVSFSLSRARRVAEERRLVNELAEVFMEKAQSGAQAFGYKTYEVKSLNFTGQAANNVPQPMMMSARAGAADQAFVPIPSEGGRSSVGISVAGTVEYAR